MASDQAIRHQRKTWNRRVATWDNHNSQGMQTIANALLESADIGPGVRAVDLGCGTGRLALAMAERGADVLAVDVSQAMIEELEAQATKLGLGTVRGLAHAIEHLSLPPESCDLIVSNYALHHLRDADKARLVRQAVGWLRPGGSFIVADMMFGRGTNPDDRRIIVDKVRAMASKGIPGYWRILKNAFRFLARAQERPLSLEAWQRLFSDAGLVDVEGRRVVAEASIVRGEKAGAPLPS